MPSGREVYFTKFDEAEFSRKLLAKYPQVRFAENLDNVTASSGVVFVDSIDTASSSRVEFFLAEPGWHPLFGPSRFGKREMIVNIPECRGMIDRSSNGWGPNEFDQVGEPRWIEEGHVHIFFDHPPTKEQRSFRDMIWRMFAQIGTWKLQPYERHPHRTVDWKKTDKRIWAGNDAIRWARENPLRKFSGGQFLYRPLDAQEE